MSYLSKFILSYNMKNTKIYFLIIVGIIISSFLITSLCSVILVYQHSFYNFYKYKNGNYEIKIDKLNDNDINDLYNNRLINKVIEVGLIGKIKEKKHNILFYDMTNYSMNYLNIKVIKGRKPNNNSEIVLTSDLMYDYNLELNSNIDLNAIVPNSNNTFHKTYKIVGIIHNPRRESLYITSCTPCFYKDAFIKLKYPKNYKIFLNKFKSRYKNISLNNDIIKWEYNNLDNNTFRKKFLVIVLSLILVIMIIILSLKNSFDIVIYMNGHIYDILERIGATKSDINKIILEKLYIISSIGIFIGIFSGLITTKLLIIYLNSLNFSIFKYVVFIHKIPFKAFFISLIFNYLILLVYSFLVINKRKQTRNIKSVKRYKNSYRNIRIPSLISRIYKIEGNITYILYKSEKSKCFYTFISFVLIITLFIDLSCFAYYINDINYKLNTSSLFNYSAYLNETYDNDIIYKKIDKLKYKKYYIYNLKGENYYYNDKKVNIKILDDNLYKLYINYIDGNYDKLKDRGIVINKDFDNNISIFNNNVKYTFKTYYTNKKYPFEQDVNKNIIVFNKNLFKDNIYLSQVLFKTRKQKRLTKAIRRVDNNIAIYDVDKEININNKLIYLCSLIIHSFIVILILLGLISILNIILYNSNFREMVQTILISIGMTSNTFSNIASYEYLIFSFKSFIVGILLSLLINYFMYLKFNNIIHISFYLPIKEVIILFIVLFILCIFIKRYLRWKILNENILDIIRSNNY